MTANPIPRADFDALVAALGIELAEVSDERRAQFFTVPRRQAPDAWRGLSWPRQWIGIADVMALTGLSRNTVEQFQKRARKAREAGDTAVRYTWARRRHKRRLMPPSRETDGRREWMAGEIALWAAAKGPHWEGREKTEVMQEPVQEPDEEGAVLATDEELADAARQAVKLRGAGAVRADVIPVLDAAGLYAGMARIGRALIRPRWEHVQACKAGDGADLGVLESVRPGGLVIGAQIARAFGVTEGAVTRARNIGHLTPAGKWQYGPLYDPAKVTVRKDGGRGPVDAGSEWAWTPEPELAR